MNKFLFVVATIILLSSCQSNEDKANTLIDKWMSGNKPTATYVKVALVESLSFTSEDQHTLDSLRVLLDSAGTYQKLKLNKEVIKPSLSGYEEQLSSMLDGLNDKIEEAASKHYSEIQGEINNFEDTHRAKIMGEKGYKARLSYSLDNTTKKIVFYFDKSLSSIIAVEEK